MKDKLKSYSFWMSVSAAVVLVINKIGKHFGFYLDNEIVAEIVDSICGVLILFGVITMTKGDKKHGEEQDSSASEGSEQKDELNQIKKIDDRIISTEKQCERQKRTNSPNK